MGVWIRIFDWSFYWDCHYKNMDIGKRRMKKERTISAVFFMFATVWIVGCSYIISITR
jgi:hypothetical protein